MTNGHFENPRNIVRAGFVCVAIALTFTFVGKHWLPSVASEDVFDAIAGLLHGVAFGLLGLGAWRLSRGRAGGTNHHDH